MHIFRGLSKYTLPVIVFSLVASHGIAKASVPLDSIRTETYKNHQVIIYKVGKKETFYSISRRYKLPASELILLNEGKTGLRIGDEIRVPLKASVTEAPAETASLKPSVQPYKVEKGGTVYSIARKFGMTPAKIIELNNLKNTALKPGQSLKIVISQHEHAEPAEPAGKHAPVTATPAADSPSKKNLPAAVVLTPKILIPSTGLYVVQSGETVYSIASRYGIEVSRIQELNHLTGSGIHSGQTIKLNEGAAQPASKAVPYPVEKEEKEENSPSKNSSGSAGNQNSGPVIPRPAATIPNLKAPEVVLPSPDADKSVHSGREMKEDGIGLWLNNNDLNQARSVALHRTAPVGTIIKVTNPMSRKSIFVKVVGSFPDTAENKDAVVIISKSAAELIGALDQRFRVEISYVN